MGTLYWTGEVSDDWATVENWSTLSAHGIGVQPILAPWIESAGVVQYADYDLNEASLVDHACTINTPTSIGMAAHPTEITGSCSACQICHGTIHSGNFTAINFQNSGSINGGTFSGSGGSSVGEPHPMNSGTINGGTFYDIDLYCIFENSGVIYGGSFSYGNMENSNTGVIDAPYLPIYPDFGVLLLNNYGLIAGGNFTQQTGGQFTNFYSISGGEFTGDNFSNSSNANINSGTFSGDNFTNSGNIYGGDFANTNVYNTGTGTIHDSSVATFSGDGFRNYGYIMGGTFTGSFLNGCNYSLDDYAGTEYGTIRGGLFTNLDFINRYNYPYAAVISGGTYSPTKYVDFSALIANDGTVNYASAVPPTNSWGSYTIWGFQQGTFLPIIHVANIPDILGTGLL